MAPDLNAMALFARVVEAESFTAAARAQGLSKSAVSKQIARLEDRLGARLLNRTTRRLSLTEAGSAFYEACQKVVAEAESAEQAVTHLAAAPRGQLRVNAPMSFGQLHVAPMLPEFLGACPELSLDLDLNDRQVDLVEEGYDVAIRIGVLDDSSLIVRRLAPSRNILCAAPAYLEAHGHPSVPADLTEHNVLLYSYRTRGSVVRLRGSGGERSVTVRGRLRVNNGDALLAAALGGLGIAFLPSFIVGDALRAGDLQCLLPDWRDAAEAGVHAVYPASRNLSPKVRVFVDFLSRRFGATPYWDRGIQV